MIKKHASGQITGFELLHYWPAGTEQELVETVAIASVATCEWDGREPDSLRVWLRISRLAHSEVLAARSRVPERGEPALPWHPRSEVRTRRFCRSRGEEASAFEMPSWVLGFSPGSHELDI